MGLKSLKIIGNGDAFGSGGHYHTCLYLESINTNFLVDLGATAIHNLQRRIDINEIDMIIVSHFHGDHIGGIPFFLLASTFLTGRIKPLTIIGPKDCEQRIMGLTEALYAGVTKKFTSFELRFMEYQSGNPIKIADIEILALPAIHSHLSHPHCIRVNSGDKAFAYSGDSEWTDNLYRISKGVDYFICECTYFSSVQEGHLTYVKDIDNLNKLEAMNILLTHLGKEMLEGINESKISIEITEENKTYNF